MSMFYASEAALVPNKNLYDLKKLNFVHTSFHSTVECVAHWPWTPVGLQFPLLAAGDVLGVVTQPGSGGLQTSGKPKLRMFHHLKCLSFEEELEEPGPSSNPHRSLSLCS